MSAGFDCYRGARVFVTGHTGFKGSWLCEWLLSLGADVRGFALEPPTDPALFDKLGLAGRIGSHEIGDIRDREALAEINEKADGIECVIACGIKTGKKPYDIDQILEEADKLMYADKRAIKISRGDDPDAR